MRKALIAIAERMILGDIPMLRENPLETFLASCEARPVTRFRIAGQATYLISDPELVKHVLVENQSNYDKRTRSWKNITLVIGENIITSSGEYWKVHRKIAAQAFQREQINVVSPHFLTVTRERAQGWIQGNAGSSVIDVGQEMLYCFLLSASRSMFGADINDEEFEMLAINLPRLAQLLSQRNRSIVLPLWAPTKSNRELKSCLKPIENVVKKIIKQKQEKLSKSKPGEAPDKDLLTLLMLACDEETGQKMTYSELLDEVLGFFFAGQDATTAALTWFWILLNRYPQEIAAIRCEIEREIGSRLPDVNDLSGLSRLNQVMHETLRLYPPAWLFERRSLGDDRLHDQHIKKGDLIYICPYGMHRSSKLWTEPDKFLPSRFEGNWKAKTNRFAFMPFGAGPRTCLGLSFAMVEMQLLMAYLIPRFNVKITDLDAIKPSPSVLLRPDQPVKMQIERTSVPL
jgi:cytochrome P450